jgi:hypothetical protein
MYHVETFDFGLVRTVCHTSDVNTLAEIVRFLFTVNNETVIVSNDKTNYECGFDDYASFEAELPEITKS